MKSIYPIIAILTCLLSLVGGCRKETPRERVMAHESDSLYAIARTMLYSDPVAARRLLAEELSRQTSPDSLRWYRLLNLYAKTLIITSDLDSALLLGRQTESYCARKERLSPQDYLLLADASNNAGNIYATTSQSDSALKYFGQTLRFGKLAGDRLTELTASNNLADVYTRRGDFAQGAYHYRKALLIADSASIPGEELINTYIGLGITYMELRDFERFHHYFDLAGAMYDQMDMNRKLGYLINRGNGSFYEGDYAGSLRLFRECYELAKQVPEYEYFKYLCLVNMGEMYLHAKKTDSARNCLDTAYVYFGKLGNQTLLYHIETLLAELALEQNDLATAKRYLDKNDGEGFIEPNSIVLRDKSLQRYYAGQGDYRLAYRYQAESARLEDSLRNDRTRMRTAEIDLRYRHDTALLRQQMFIQEQQNDMRSLRQWGYISALGCALLLLTAFFIYFYQRKKRAFLLEQSRSRAIALRMENVRNRLSPHFIFNTLSRVVGSMGEESRSRETLTDLIKVMRLNLRMTERSRVTLAEELDFTHTYIELERRRLNGELEADITLGPRIDPDTISLPAMLIQIPVENAIKHGLRAKDADRQLRISITDEGDRIRIAIEDNGIGFQAAANLTDTRGTGTGLRVISQTIQLLNSHNKRQIRMNVTRNPRGDERFPGCLVEYILPKDFNYDLPANETSNNKQ